MVCSTWDRQKTDADQTILRRKIMVKPQNPKGQFAVCIKTDDADVLTPWKIYQVLPDESAAKSHYIRVIDNEGEDYLYSVIILFSLIFLRKEKVPCCPRLREGTFLTSLYGILAKEEMYASPSPPADASSVRSSARLIRAVRFIHCCHMPTVIWRFSNMTQKEDSLVQQDSTLLKARDDYRLHWIQEAFWREQEFFWHRFSAFAVLHGGLFVLATSDSLSNPTLYIGLGYCLHLLGYSFNGQVCTT